MKYQSFLSQATSWAKHIELQKCKKTQKCPQHAKKHHHQPKRLLNRPEKKVHARSLTNRNPLLELNASLGTLGPFNRAKSTGRCVCLTRGHRTAKQLIHMLVRTNVLDHRQLVTQPKIIIKVAYNHVFGAIVEPQ
jgi:hypothetical protein